MLMKTAQCASMAAAVYPDFVELLKKNNVPEYDRAEVARLLAEVLVVKPEKQTVLQ